MQYLLDTHTLIWFQENNVALSEPPKAAELPDVRKLLLDFGWNTSGITDHELMLYLISCIQKNYKYYLDFEFDKQHGKPNKLHIKLTEDHPDFSPDWLIENDLQEDIMDKEIKPDDIETVHSESTLTIEEEFEPPPPPDNTPPKNPSL